jgi:phage shock protein PspC (stress-responsive transcriptional regulator)
MGRSRENSRERDKPTDRIDTVRAEEMADRNGEAQGTTDSYTLTPPVRVVEEETTRRAAPREEVQVQQRAVPTVRPARPRGEQELDIPESYALDHDRVRWPAVFAGLLTALTMLIALGVLGLAVGLTSVDAGQAVAQRGVPSGLGLGSGIWAGLSALLAFLLGGWVAGRTAAVFGKGWGALNGMLVFLLAVPLTLWLAGSGLGALLGSFGGFAQSLNIDPNAVRDAAGQAGQNAQQNAQQVTPEQAAQAATSARNAAWSTLLGLGLGTGAATLGGLLGTRSHLEIDRDDVAQAREGIVR